jgi:hypothetical protein
MLQLFDDNTPYTNTTSGRVESHESISDALALYTEAYYYGFGASVIRLRVEMCIV